MTIQSLANIVILLLLVVWISYRQLTWRPVAVGQMWRLPIILGVVGIVILSQSHATVKTIDIAVLAVEAVLAIGIGSLMGVLANFRPLTREAAEAYQARAQSQPRRGRGDAAQAPAPLFESRTGWFGLVLWIVFIGVRVGIEVWAGQAGSALAASTGVILVMVALNRLARTAVFASRVARLTTVAA